MPHSHSKFPPPIVFSLCFLFLCAQNETCIDVCFLLLLSWKVACYSLSHSYFFRLIYSGNNSMTVHRSFSILNICIDFFFWRRDITVYLARPMYGYSDCSQSFAVTVLWWITLCMCIFMLWMVASSGVIPRVRLVGQRINMYLFVIDIVKFPSKRAAPVCFPTMWFPRATPT